MRKRRRAGDDIFLAAESAGDKRPKALFSWLEMEQQVERERVRLALDVDLDARRLKERMAVLIEIVKFAGDVF